LQGITWLVQVPWQQWSKLSQLLWIFAQLAGARLRFKQSNGASVVTSGFVMGSSLVVNLMTVMPSLKLPKRIQNSIRNFAYKILNLRRT
jgi:hypothetical protein